MFSQAEKYVDARSNWAGCWGLRSEAIDGLTLDGVLLVVHGEDNLGDGLELLDWGICREKIDPYK